METPGGLNAISSESRLCHEWGLEGEGDRGYGETLSTNNGIKETGNVETGGGENSGTLFLQSECFLYAVTDHHEIDVGIKTGFGPEFRKGGRLSTLTPVFRLHFPQHSVLPIFNFHGFCPLAACTFHSILFFQFSISTVSVLSQSALSTAFCSSNLQFPRFLSSRSLHFPQHYFLPVRIFHNKSKR